jgi:hypothetical protein
MHFVRLKIPLKTQVLLYKTLFFSELQKKKLGNPKKYGWGPLEESRLKSSIFFSEVLGFELKASHLQAGVLPLEPLCQPREGYFTGYFSNGSTF